MKIRYLLQTLSHAPGSVVDESDEEYALKLILGGRAEAVSEPAKKKAGRPRGSKNKPKVVAS